MRRRASTMLTLVLGLTLSLGAAPARADHTDPDQPLVPLVGDPLGGGLALGAGTWDHIRHFAPNPGSDVKFFTKDGEIWSSSGTLGQGNEGFVGQRILRLTDGGQVDPTWVADHGSAHCQLNTSVTGLQHDQAFAPRTNPRIMVDSTDALGRCHDTGGGGLEIVDVSGLGQEGFEVREIHLIRHRGLSHTVTADPVRPGIFYNNGSDFNTPNIWIDIVDARSCMKPGTLAQKRNRCRPTVHRLSWEAHPEWSQRRDTNGNLVAGTQTSCHDITANGRRLYCAGLNATLIFDVRALFGSGNRIRGPALPCTIIDGTNTSAKVTDCNVAGPGSPSIPADPYFLGSFNHPGITQANNNLETPADEGVSISHESDPSPDQRWLFVTDERGGGVVPPGASCSPGVDNPFGNGGIHVFDITNPASIHYAETTSGDKAIWRGDAIVPAPTFCDVHVIEHIPDEQRIFMAYYSQGIKILDYEVDGQGRFSFTETASFTLPEVNSWTAQPFKIVDNQDGTRTYFLYSSDIQRGIDILSWTGPTHPIQKASGGSVRRSMAVGDLALLVVGLGGLPVAARFGRRRRAARA
jgi:hypothetical protein